MSVMARTNLKDRNPWSSQVSYTRKEQSQILKAKLKYLVCGKAKPDLLQQLHINSATVLILHLHNAQEVFEDGGALPKDFLRKLYSLQAILNKLGLKVKGPGKTKQDKSFDLADALSGD